jgi:hypothetical protein
LLSVIFKEQCIQTIMFFNVCHISLNNDVQLVICLWNRLWNIWNCVSGHTEIQKCSFLCPLPHSLQNYITYGISNIHLSQTCQTFAKPRSASKKINCKNLFKWSQLLTLSADLNSKRNMWFSSCFKSFNLYLLFLDIIIYS